MFSIFKKPAIGLDISDNSIEAVQLKKIGGQATIFAHARTKLSPGVVQDGKIKDYAKLQETIKNLLAGTEGQKFTTKQVILSLPESRTYLHTFKLSNKIKHKDLADAVEQAANGLIPASLNDLYWDFYPAGEGKSYQKVFFAAAPVDIVDSHVQVLIKAGLKPIALDFESASLARSLIKAPAKKGVVMLLDIGARTTIISIVDQGIVRSTVNIKTAGDTFTRAIAKKAELTEEEAEKQKKANGLDENKEGGKYLLILQAALQPVIEEARKSIDYYQNQTSRKVTSVILAGGSAQMPKLASYLSSNLGIPVEAGKPWVDTTEAKKMAPLLLATAIGSALRGLTNKPAKAGINLLPDEPRSKEEIDPEKKKLRAETKKLKKVNTRLLVLTILLFIAFGILGGAFWWQQRGVPDVQPRPEIVDIVIPSPVVEEAATSTDELIATSTPTSTQSAIESVEYITIADTGIGYLNVREGPGVNYEKLTQVDVGKEFELLERQTEWVKIRISENTQGWVFGQYVE